MTRRTTWDFAIAVPEEQSLAVSHGRELTVDHVGPWTLQGVAQGAESLTTMSDSSQRVSTWPGDGGGSLGQPSWIPSTTYVYNNSPSNVGGIVGSGGLEIDGYDVPAGTWVSQFRNITTDLIVSGDNSGDSAAWPGIVFRGCRWRGANGAPGFINQNGKATGGIIWLMYCDGGGTVSVAPGEATSIFESQGLVPSLMYVIRCYLSLASTLLYFRCTGDAAIENYCVDVPRFYSDDTYHLNGLANSGGQTANLWLRNNVDLSPQPDATAFGGDNPYFLAQNDVIQMAADFGTYMGTGTNLDGSTGYVIKDNYLGGAAHTLQLGVDKANTFDTVRNVQVTGNDFTTKWFTNSGSTAISYKNPQWGTHSNAWSGNVWADDYGTGSWSTANLNTTRQYPAGNGPRAGTTISAPTPG